MNAEGRFSGGRNRQKLPKRQRGTGGRLAPGLWNPSLASLQAKIGAERPNYDSLPTMEELANQLVKFWYPQRKTEILPKSAKTQKTRNSSKWRHIHKKGYPKNKLLKNVKFRF